MLLDGGFGANLELAAARGESVDDALAAQDEAAGGKIGALHDFQDLGERRVRILDQQDGGVR